MQRRKFIGTLTATVSTVALAGCGGSESGDFEEGNDNGDTNSGGSDDGGSDDSGSDDSGTDIELLEHEMVRENEGEMSESVTIEGVAKNVSGGELSYAEIEVKFFEGDTLSESSLDNINGWSSGEQWGFEVPYLAMGEDAAAITDYEIRAGTSL